MWANVLDIINVREIFFEKREEKTGSHFGLSNNNDALIESANEAPDSSKICESTARLDLKSATK